MTIPPFTCSSTLYVLAIQIVACNVPLRCSVNLTPHVQIYNATFVCPTTTIEVQQAVTPPALPVVYGTRPASMICIILPPQHPGVLHPTLQRPSVRSVWQNNNHSCRHRPAGGDAIQLTSFDCCCLCWDGDCDCTVSAVLPVAGLEDGPCAPASSSPFALALGESFIPI